MYNTYIHIPICTHLAIYTVDGRTKFPPGGFLAITRHQEVGEVPR